MSGRIDVPILENWEDVFQNQVGSRTNVLDIAGHYPYSPERWRLFSDGERLFPQYGDVSQYIHNGDYHRLLPSAGETVTLETAERPRYVVAYELAATWAYATNQSLQAGDSVRVGLYDGANGWYIEQTGDHADDRGDVVLERDGGEVYRREDIDVHSPITVPSRLRLRTAWYDVARQEWEMSYAADGDQINESIIETDANGQRGSKTGNLPLHYSVTAGAGTTDLELHPGSCAQVNLGSTTRLTRNKAEDRTLSIDTADTWVPLLALRTEPTRENVNTQLADVAITGYSTSNDVRLVAQAFAPSKVLDADGNPLSDAQYTTPSTFSAVNNVIETSTAVAQFPDSTGTPVTTAAGPGGWQVGFDTLKNGGGNTISADAPASAISKRPVYPRDVVVFLGYAEGTGDVSFQYRTEQDW